MASPSGQQITDTDTPSRITQSRSFVALAAALTLGTCASYAVIVNLVPLMGERGIDARVAAAALGLGGIGQVLGRLGYRTLVARVGVRARMAVILAAVAATTALLGVFTSMAALITVAVLAGFARGIMTLLQATAVTERWGPAHYGHLNGALSAPITLATALSPWIGSALASVLGGYTLMFLAIGAIAAVAVVISLASVPAQPHGNDLLHRSTLAYNK